MEIDVQEIFKKYYKSIFNYILVRVYYNKELALDLTSEVFERVWKNRQRYSVSKGSESTWIFTIAKNIIIDYIRKRKINYSPIYDSDQMTSKDELETNLMLEHVKKKLFELEEFDRDLIIMRYISGLEYKEISEIINKSLEATKTAVSRALAKLKDIINE